MQPVLSPFSTPPPPPLRSHWQRVALPIQLLALIIGIMLLGSARCERKQASLEKTLPSSSGVIALSNH